MEASVVFSRSIALATRYSIRYCLGLFPAISLKHLLHSTALMQAAEQLSSSAATIRAISEELSDISAQFTGMLEMLFRVSISLRANSLAVRSMRCAALANNLSEIAFYYIRTEQSVMGKF